MSLAGSVKVAVVTGSNKGIGLAIVKGPMQTLRWCRLFNFKVWLKLGRKSIVAALNESHVARC